MTESVMEVTLSYVMTMARPKVNIYREWRLSIVFKGQFE